MATVRQRIRRIAPRLAAEFLGTFGFVLFGCASIVVSSAGAYAGADSASLVAIALAHGLMLAVAVTGAVYISGAQLNPAISIALMALGRQTAVKAGMYVVTQLFAAACAAGMLILLLGADGANNPQRGTAMGATVGSLTEAGRFWPVFGFEFLLSFALMYVYLATVVDRRAPRLGGLCMGGFVAVAILSAGPLTGASMNPARTFGPALYGHWDMHWVYWVAPVWGAAMAAGVYRLLGQREVAE
ncbi:MAG: aquaporin [Phycisphaerales bacterium JB039]